MKKLLFSVSALLGFSVFTNADAACCENFYVGALGGADWSRTDNHNHGHHHHHDSKVGGILGATVGYRWGDCCGCGLNGLRTEAEFAYRANKHHHEDGGHRRVRTTSILANVLYDIQTCYCFTPFLGAGIGYANTSKSHEEGHHQKGFAWQLIAGVSYPLCDCIDVDLEYHYFVPKKSHHHTLALGARYFF